MEITSNAFSITICVPTASRVGFTKHFLFISKGNIFID